MTLVAWPLLAAFAMALLPLLVAPLVWIWPTIARVAGLATSGIMVVLGMAVAAGIEGHGELALTLGGWPGALGIGLRLDGMAAAFLLLGAVVGLGAGVHAAGYFGRGEMFWPLWLLLWAALNALFLSADAFNAYVTLELLSLVAVALVALQGGREALRAALRYLLMALAAALVYLAGVAILYARDGTLSLGALGPLAGDPLAAVAAGLILAGLAVKAAIFPLHAWLPPAHARAPGPVSALLSALVVKGAIYLLWRWQVEVFGAPPGPGLILGALGVGAVLWGGWRALTVPRLKAIVAYSTVAQMGYLLVALALVSGAQAVGGARGGESAELARTGFLYLVLSHGLAKGAAFLAAANVLYAAGHDRWPSAAGVLRGRPLTLLAFGLAAVSLAGLPPSGGFLAKWYLLMAAIGSNQWWAAIILLFGGLLAAAYLYRIIHPGLDPRDPRGEVRAPSASMEWAALGLALLSLLIGLWVPWGDALLMPRKEETA
ncbi:MAG: complex I subunit 5 family protein [Pseudomonadota bacterium]